MGIKYYELSDEAEGIGGATEARKIPTTFFFFELEGGFHYEKLDGIEAILADFPFSIRSGCSSKVQANIYCEGVF